MRIARPSIPLVARQRVLLQGACESLLSQDGVVARLARLTGLKVERQLLVGLQLDFQRKQPSIVSSASEGDE